MQLKKISKWVVIAGVLLIAIIKWVIRPFVELPVMLKPFIGLAPNLISSFLVPFGACLFFQRFFRLQSMRDLKLTCSFGLLLVVINEYLQLIPVFGRTFDYLDLLSSVVGAGLGYFVFARCMYARGQLRSAL